MVALNNNSQSDFGHPPPDAHIYQIFKDFTLSLGLEIRIYETPPEFSKSNLARYVVHVVNPDSEISQEFLHFKLRAFVDKSKPAVESGHIAIDVFEKGEIQGSCLLDIDAKSIGHHLITDHDIALLKEILRSGTYRVDPL